MDMPVLGNQQELIYDSSVLTQDVVWKTCQKWWMIGTNGKRKSGESMLAAWLDNDDESLYIIINVKKKKKKDFLLQIVYTTCNIRSRIYQTVKFNAKDFINR